MKSARRRTIAFTQVFEQQWGKAMDKVVCYEISDDVVLERLCGRRMCRGCNANYHVAYIPPQQEGVCDRCGQELYQRDDDTEDTIRERLSVYHEQTAPLVEYYENKGVLARIPADREIDEIREATLQALA